MPISGADWPPQLGVLVMADNKEDIKRAVIEAFQEAKKTLIGFGSVSAQRVFKQVLEIPDEDFGNDPEQIHAVQEGRLVAALFTMHGVAIDKMTNIFCSMIEEGVLVPDRKMASKVAKEKKKQVEKMMEEMEDDGEGEEWKKGNSDDE